MITKGIIQSINGNKFIVRLPVLEKPGLINVTTSLNNTLEATLNTPPGLYDAYNINDVVFVSFEDNQINKPIILGKLLLNEKENNVTSQLSINSLNVTGIANLPKNTRIGNINYGDLESAVNIINTLGIDPSGTIITYEMVVKALGYTPLNKNKFILSQDRKSLTIDLD